MGKEKYIEQCKGDSQENHQNQSTHVGLEKELQERGRTTIVPII